MAFLLPLLGEVVGALWELGEAAELAEVSFQTAAIVDVAATAVTAQMLVPIVMYSKNTRGRSTTETSSGDEAMDHDTHYYFESPCATPDTLMGGVPTKRPVTPIETPKPKRVYEEVMEPRHPARQVKHTGPSYTAGWCRDFSGVQRTRVNPVTGRIIGYKGIPRKRRLSPVSKYSSFWRDQKYAKPSLHASRSPGIWDSARR